MHHCDKKIGNGRGYASNQRAGVRGSSIYFLLNFAVNFKTNEILQARQNTGVGSCSLLQEIFPTQGWNPGLRHCRQILYQLSHQGSPNRKLPHCSNWVKGSVSQSVVFDSLWDRIDCSLPGYSIHGIPQARILEWVAIPFSRGSSQSKDQTQVSCIA